MGVRWIKKKKRNSNLSIKKKEQDAIRDSIPISIEQLKELLSYVDREDAQECDHTLKKSLDFIKSKNLNADKVVSWLNDHGGFCDCEVIANVYNAVGDIVEWHLDENR